MDGWMDGWLDGWMDGRTDGWMDGWMNGWMDGGMDGPHPPSLLGDGFEFSFTNWQCVISEPAPLGAPGGFMRSPFCFEESWICRIRAVLLFNMLKKGAPDPALT